MYCTTSQYWSISSPNGQIEFELRLAEHNTTTTHLAYDLLSNGTHIIQASYLGLQLDPGNIGMNLTHIGCSYSSHDEVEEWTFGPVSTYHDVYNALTVSFIDPYTFIELEIEVRVTDQGVAFRYILPQQPGTNGATITAEDTRFRFLDDHQGYRQYGTEADYVLQKISSITGKCENPLTIDLQDNGLVSITEAAVHDYPRMYLTSNAPNELRSVLASKVVLSGTHKTPWRTILIADSPTDLIDASHMVHFLNEPSAIGNTSWIRPGSTIRDCQLKTSNSLACIDFAAEQGLAYVELDAGWYGKEWSTKDATKVAVDGLNLTRIIEYGKEKGVGVIVYVNRVALVGKIDKLFPLYQQWGLAGVKMGFMDGRTQDGINFIHKAVALAAKHKLVIDVHDNYRPSGYERTYPNLMTIEGVQCDEHPVKAEQNCILPFTRGLCGPIDKAHRFYVMNGATTKTHQLAMPLIVFSPLAFLFWYQNPQKVEGDSGLDAWKALPTVWDSTAYLDCEIGGYVTVLRTSGSTFYLGSINGPDERSISVSCDFLQNGQSYIADVFTDATNGSLSHRTYEVGKSTIINEELGARGGLFIRFCVNDTSNATEYPPVFIGPYHRQIIQDEILLFKCVELNGHKDIEISFITNADFISFDPISLTVSGRPNNSDVGEHTIQVEMVQGGISVGSATYTIVVEDKNDPPRFLVRPASIEFRREQLCCYCFQVTDIDPTGDQLRWDIETNASFINFDEDLGIVYGIAKQVDIGRSFLNITLSDGRGGSDHLNTTIIVRCTLVNNTSGSMMVSAAEVTSVSTHSNMNGTSSSIVHQYVNYSLAHDDPTDDNGSTNISVQVINQWDHDTGDGPKDTDDELPSMILICCVIVSCFSIQSLVFGILFRSRDKRPRASKDEKKKGGK